ncbi:acyltransferase family protein [Leptothoe sp. EHU-05/26/07-4]
MRHYDFDWIRTVVILNLIPLHVVWLMLFIPGFSQVETASMTALLLKLYIALVSSWHMPLLFLIAGYSAAVSLSKRSIRDFYRERIQRLLIPLVIFMVTLGPIQRYLWPNHLVPRNLTDFFIHYLPLHMGTILLGPCGSRLGPRWEHLWFLAYLLVMSFTVLVVLIRLSRATIMAMANLLYRHIIWLPMLGFGGAMATLGYVWPLFDCQTLFQDWGHFVYNLWAFVIGYLMYVDSRLGKAIQAKAGLFYSLFLVSLLARLLLLSQYQENFYGDTSDLGLYLLRSAITGVHTWSAIASILILTRRHLATITNPFLKYMGQASLPIYIVHHPLIVILGLYIPKLGLSIFPEFLVLTILTTLFTFLTYEFLIKPWPLVRMGFGMKP